MIHNRHPVKEYQDPEDGRRECSVCGEAVVGYGPGLHHADAALDLAVTATKAHARSEDPVTSHAAAATAGPLRPAQRAVLRLLEAFPAGLSDEELVEEYQASRRGRPDVMAQTASGLRSRRKELADAGLVVLTDEVRRTAANRPTRVWRAAQTETLA